MPNVRRGVRHFYFFGLAKNLKELEPVYQVSMIGGCFLREFFEENAEKLNLSGNFWKTSAGVLFLNFRMLGDKLTNQR